MGELIQKWFSFHAAKWLPLLFWFTPKHTEWLHPKIHRSDHHSGSDVTSNRLHYAVFGSDPHSLRKKLECRYSISLSLHVMKCRATLFCWHSEYKYLKPECRSTITFYSVRKQIKRTFSPRIENMRTLIWINSLWRSPFILNSRHTSRYPALLNADIYSSYIQERGGQICSSDDPYKVRLSRPHAPLSGQLNRGTGFWLQTFIISPGDEYKHLSTCMGEDHAHSTNPPDLNYLSWCYRQMLTVLTDSHEPCSDQDGWSAVSAGVYRSRAAEYLICCCCYGWVANKSIISVGMVNDHRSVSRLTSGLRRRKFHPCYIHERFAWTSKADVLWKTKLIVLHALNRRLRNRFTYSVSSFATMPHARVRRAGYMHGHTLKFSCISYALRTCKLSIEIPYSCRMCIECAKCIQAPLPHTSPPPTAQSVHAPFRGPCVQR